MQHPLHHSHTSASAQPLTIHLITHNHWDREWIFTARYANRWLLPFFDNLLARLAEQPDYRFVLDGQTLIIEDYLAQLAPEKAAQRERDIRRFARSGQLLLGPAYLQPDWSLVSGESLVRNLLIGDRVARRYGAPMKAAWLLDNFGQVAQAPQILAGFGIEGAFVWRGIEMPPEQLRTEFWWQAPDGTRVLGVYLLDSYRNAMVLSMTREIAQQRILAHTGTLQRFATTPNVLLMNGYEQVPQPDDVLPIIAQFNQQHGPAMRAVQSTPPDYLAAVQAYQPDLPVLTGYFYSGRYAPILKGVYSSRSYLNQQNNECQRELERWAEKFSTFAWAYGSDYPTERMLKAWKTLLLNHTHDDLCGCCIDPIARDMVERFAEVDRSARIMSGESLQAIAQSVDTTQAPGPGIVIFNPSSRVRSEVVGIGIEVPESWESFSLVDGQGQPLPYQVQNSIGSRTELYLWAADVPSVGYRIFYLTPQASPAAPAASPVVTASAADQRMENQHLAVAIEADGALTVHDKARGRVYAGLGYFEDGGDCGDTYDYSYPAEDQVILSRGGEARVTLEVAGPLLARFRIETELVLPASLAADRQSRSPERRVLPIISFVELAAHSRHVEVRTTISNTVKDHRLRVLFPSGVQTEVAHVGMPFDVAEFPVEESGNNGELPPQLAGLMLAGRYIAPVNTHPFQDFVSLVDAQAGLTVFSRGLNEFQVLPEQGNAIALTMLRSVGWLARSDLLTRIGDVGPHIFTPEAQGLGEQTFEYGIYPHGPDLWAANPHYESDRHALKFRAVRTDAHPGRLPGELSFLSWIVQVPAYAFKLTALKHSEAEDGLIVRLYNACDQEARGQLRLGGLVVKAWRANLNEEPLAELPVQDGNIPVVAKPKEIVTLKVKLSRSRLIYDFPSAATRILPPLTPRADFAVDDPPLLLSEEEVHSEQMRAQTLSEGLHVIRSDIYDLQEAIERQAEPPVQQLAALQKLKGQEATLARQYHEARISALLNQQLLITHQIETELDGIGEQLNWARVRKRVGEFLIHYYDGLMSQ
ncbi:MAG TPA: glycoside hydrolase family 38 C-terminal domain-containing protein [Anaerolineae bacterium]|nr:glycoside hydrolase family 38 C-terminal domain-containing protein [Anaerolineae bacterium]HNU04357.1 glycoside hydrolase family 38 C-terminal domain-containing protein [Anaerolineae bacterium]